MGCLRSTGWFREDDQFVGSYGVSSRSEQVTSDSPRPNTIRTKTPNRGNSKCGRIVAANASKDIQKHKCTTYVCSGFHPKQQKPAISTEFLSCETEAPFAIRTGALQKSWRSNTDEIAPKLSSAAAPSLGDGGLAASAFARSLATVSQLSLWG